MKKFISAILICILMLLLTGCHGSQEQKLFKIPLTKGEHTVKIEHARSNFVPYKFRLTKVGDVWQGRNDGFDTNIINAVIK